MLATRLQGSASGHGVATDNNRQQEPDVKDHMVPATDGGLRAITCHAQQAPERNHPCFPDKLGDTGHFLGITFMGITV